MGHSTDPATVVLTGQLPFLLLVAAVLTWPISVALLWIYTRAVRRSMGARASRSEPVADSSMQPVVSANPPTVELRELTERPSGGTETGTERMWRDLMMRPWRAAAAYALAGFAYSTVTTAASHVALGLEVLPFRFAIFLWLYVWPAVLSANIVAASTRRAKTILTAGYFAGYLLLGVGSSIAASNWGLVGQAGLLWGITNGPPTVLLLACLTRRIRAVGPLVLTFMFLALAGSNLVIEFVGASDSRIRTVVEIVSSVGLGAYAGMALMVVSGFLMFGVLGAAALAWLSRRYRAKAISDESVTIDTIWLLFAFVHSFTLVFEHPVWIVVSPLAFVAYRLSARLVIRRTVRRLPPATNPPRLLVLRSFAIGKESERLFDSLEKHWRRTGSIHLIAGVDLATRTVEPHEFLEFLTGRLARRFITDASVLERRIGEMDVAPDRDLRFRVNDFFCHEDTWRMVLSRLLPESDAVVMDLRGFSRRNEGCVFELGELARAGVLQHVVFLVNDRTNMQLFVETIEAALASTPAGPERGRQTTIGIVRSRSLARDLRVVLQALAEARSVADPVHT